MWPASNIVLTGNYHHVVQKGNPDIDLVFYFDFVA